MTDGVQTLIALACVSAVSGFVGFVLGVIGHSAAVRRKVLRMESTEWVELPTGFTKTQKGLIGYITRVDGVFHWWVHRNNKTIIEGPARTFQLAKQEIESAMHDFGRD